MDIYRMRLTNSITTVLFWLLTAWPLAAQNKKEDKTPFAGVSLKNGVLYWQGSGSELSLFGVNYTAPFAYSYRAIARAGIAHEEAIRNDVYHFARLGLDAFRVHVWDTEISDRNGNLLENEHLRLFDFLLAELRKYRIKTIITPIAFWGNGYPEPDEKTPGFSGYFGKGRATVTDSAIQAQENYLEQFFTHVNPYTGLTYREDAAVIATEINNEPNHSGTAEGVTRYINRLYDAIRSTGWEKPIFYNISENPGYAAATAASKADGFSFQWYPSGLVGGQTLQNNYLPHVDKYVIPFGDTVAAFKGKPLMVYEFDPADLMHPIMYPAMARSFRSAGFQWATQFAYDPMAIAHANTEYQTHYLNLAYTPAKAISMLIAAEVFRAVPRKAIFRNYPSDSAFGPFRLSFREGISEMNGNNQFYHTGNTATLPVAPDSLLHIAGVGSSPLVDYGGSGAYFLDRLNHHTWRIEIMPDAVPVADPFAKTSPARPVSVIEWNSHRITLNLASLGKTYHIKGLNTGNNFEGIAEGGSFMATPGTYLLSSAPVNITGLPAFAGTLPLNGFAAPPPAQNTVSISHEVWGNRMEGGRPVVNATLTGAKGARLFLLVKRQGWAKPQRIPMNGGQNAHFSAAIPNELVIPGLLQYRIAVYSDSVYTSFPGAVKGDPFAWDYAEGGYWQLAIREAGADLPLFDASTHTNPVVFPAWGRGIQQGIVPSATAGHFLFSYRAGQWGKEGIAVLQQPAAQKITPPDTLLQGYQSAAIRAKATGPNPVKAKLILVTKDAVAWESEVNLKPDFTETVIPFSAFRPRKFVLLPRPYPGFHPLWFAAATGTAAAPPLKPADIDLVQFVVEKNENGNLAGPGFEIEWISLRKL